MVDLHTSIPRKPIVLASVFALSARSADTVSSAGTDTAPEAGTDTSSDTDIGTVPDESDDAGDTGADAVGGLRPRRG